MPNIKLSSKPAIRTVCFENFKGVDFNSELGAVSMSRSPDCVNMISDQGGRPVKRFGYEKLLQVSGRINGIFKLVQKGVEKKIIHCGTTLYLWNDNNTVTQLYAAMNDARSSAYQMNSKLWILDGKALLCYDGAKVQTAQSMAYIPTTTINAPPQGGGTSFEAVNMLTPQRKNSFLAKPEDKVFQLDAYQVTGIVKCEYLDSDGSWKTISGGYSLQDGTKVVFATAPAKTTVNQDDNVRITFSKPVAGSADKINKCTTGILWGMGGYNRLFVTGNPGQVNADYASDIAVMQEEVAGTQSDPRDAPTFFPDVGYSLVGQDNTRIIGYLRSGENLAILKEDNDQDATVFLRNAVLSSSKNENDVTVLFPIKTGIAGVGAVSPFCTRDLRDDHMFLSKQGVFAITTNAVTSERYAQARSELINKKLCREPSLAEAVGVEYDGYLYIAVNGHVYVADGAQRDYQGKSAEQYQYEWYYWDNVPVRCWFKDGDRLLFGTPDGRIMRFYNVKHSSSYNDDGQPIPAWWTTPEIAFDTYSRYKTIRGIYTKLNPYSRSSVRIYLKEGGAFVPIDEQTADVFTWDDIDFKRFSFNLDTDVNVICTKVKSKKVITTQLRFENKKPDEAFGLYGATIYYDLKTRVK